MEKESIYLLDSAQINFYWQKIEEGLLSCDFFDYWKPETVFHRCLNGAMQCWALSNGSIELIIVSDIVNYDTGKTLRFIGAFGKGIDKYLEVAESIFPRVAAATNCVGYEVVGRPGWEKKLKALGFKPKFTVYHRPLELKQTEH